VKILAQENEALNLGDGAFGNVEKVGTVLGMPPLRALGDVGQELCGQAYRSSTGGCFVAS
jgi:hypothetical protein